MTTPRTPITPGEFERDMHDLDDRLEQLRLELVDARNGELAAKREFEIAKVRAAAHPSCPRVKRGEVTVGERQAWIDAYVLDATLALDAAKSLRVIAAEALRTAQKQVEINQSIGASLRTSQGSYGSQSYGRRP